MSSKTHLVDPVHFFDERGHALSTVDTLEKQVAALRAQNERLKAQVAALVRRAAMMRDAETSIAIVLH